MRDFSFTTYTFTKRLLGVTAMIGQEPMQQLGGSTVMDLEPLNTTNWFVLLGTEDDQQREVEVFELEP